MERSSLISRLLANIDALEEALAARASAGGAQPSPDTREERLNKLLIEEDVDEDAIEDSPYADHLRALRRLRRKLGKRNYNLDHLARMNFRRSDRASFALNNRHVLQGL